MQSPIPSSGWLNFSRPFLAQFNTTIYRSEQGGLRPVLILSHNVFNERSGTVIAVAITSQPQKAGYPLTLELETSGLPKKSWVKISQIRVLSKKRIGKKITKTSDEELALIIDGLNEIIGG